MVALVLTEVDRTGAVPQHAGRHSDGTGRRPGGVRHFSSSHVKAAEVTPPVGFNMSVIQGLADSKAGTVSKAALPFFLVMVLFSALIVAFPSIVMWLTRLGR